MNKLTFYRRGAAGDGVRTMRGLLIPILLGTSLALSLAATSLVLGAISNQLSRRVEARADTFALELTHDPRAFIELQQRLTVINVGDPDPPSALQAVFGTHPTAIDRIGAAVSYERERGNAATASDR